MASSITIKDLKKHFGTNNQVVKAVDDISFSVKSGEIMGFLGPNGAGKSTTIRCLMDFIKPTAGSVKILGQDANQNSSKLKSDIGFLSGEVNLHASWKGSEHIEFVQKIRKDSYQDEIDKLVKMFNYDPSKRVKDLSTGNKQKLGLILALMHSPKILILDEPTTGLDPLLQQTFYEIIRKRSKAGATVLMSSHNLAEVERLCDRVAVIREGKLVGVESIRAMKKKKLYSIRVYFDGEVPYENALNTKEITVEREIDGGYVLSGKGDIDLILKELREYKLKDLEIQHANLEKVFLEFYK